MNAKIVRRAELLELLARFPRCRVAVIGDLMLDCYVWGQVERISPEAPVPVVQVTKVTRCLGGAANVMRNIMTLGGGKVNALGVVGADVHGTDICSMLRDYGIDDALIATDPSRQSIQKQRVIAGSQQLLRIDYEESAGLCEPLRRRLIEAVKKLIAEHAIDALVLEDYAKGLFSEAMAQELVDAANAAGVMTVLDPNPRNPMRLRGVTMMKPNRGEALALAGERAVAPPVADPAKDPQLRRVAEKLLAEWELKYLLISLAAQGMAMFSAAGDFTVIPTRAREVYDVSGAGDTVVAAATLALAVGGDAISAAELANHAAGIVVRQLGTATVSAAELRESINNTQG